MAEPSSHHAAEDERRLAQIRRRWAVRTAKWRTFMAQHPLLFWTWRILVIIVGVIVIIAGILMLVLPGPGWLTIFLGLAILGSEFAWARRLLTWTRIRVYAAAHRLQAWWKQRRDS
ncbi:TIGR02611 family protein [Canibacter zhoujuaniae]|uniref:TIGR02611 family protein n=1 Tax=Canibacter zhoujuaniae TaxID=2708343 RepID=UPI001421E799|nr:TIGR02611 family protein [Canibacter zhoujuaniae]